MRTKQLAIGVFALAIIGIGVFAFVSWQQRVQELAPAEPVEEGSQPKYQLIGTSVQGRKIEAYTYGDGDTHLLFVGGIHGGYEWNSVLLSYAFMDYLDANPEVVPDNITVTVIPSANPDGVYEVVGREGRFTAADVSPSAANGTGRFNANGVDLNRNFPCKWQPEAVWRGNTVSAGSAPFSEPETQTFQDFVLEHNPAAVVFWHSQANAVYPAECGGDISPETRDIMNAYAAASGYQAAETFDAYEVTGAADGWLATIGIPTLTVELQTHESIEWERNLAGIKSLFDYYARK